MDHIFFEAIKLLEWRMPKIVEKGLIASYIINIYSKFFETDHIVTILVKVV